MSEMFTDSLKTNAFEQMSKWENMSSSGKWNRYYHELFFYCLILLCSPRTVISIVECVCVLARVCTLSLSVVFDFLWPPWTVARQAPLSMEFSRQEYWSGLPFPTPGDLPDPVVEPASLMAPELASGFCSTEPPVKPCRGSLIFIY